MELERDDIWAIAGNTAFAATMLAVGVFLGIEVTARLVLSHAPVVMASAPPWLATVETVRHVLFVVILVGFGAMLALEHHTT